MKACVKDRLNGFKYGKQEFYLIGHFYNNDNPDIKARIDDRLNNADENQRDKMREWIKALRFYDKSRTFAEGSLAYAVEQALKSAKEET